LRSIPQLRFNAPARKAPAQFFWGRCASLKPSRFLFTIEKIGAFAYNKGFAFPFPSYYGVSAAVFAFYKTLGFRFTMEVFHQGLRFPVFQATTASQLLSSPSTRL
jgi:hypothetical protein